MGSGSSMSSFSQSHLISIFTTAVVKFYECSSFFIFLFSSVAKILVGQVVMANYNPDEPDERGYWYDVKITKKVN